MSDNTEEDVMPLPELSDEERALVEELRTVVGQKISSTMDDMDCMRFLRARKSNIDRASTMVKNWYEWRHTALEPIPPFEEELVLTPATIMIFPRPLDEHPHANLLPTSHHGFDREGRPIYWEKTGRIQATMPQVKEHFSNTELIHFHIMSQELFDMRCKYASKKFGHFVHQCVIVFDMSDISASLDMDSIYYIKSILKIDQDFYPERLFKLVIINAPWYFTAIYNLFYYLMDPKTRDKIEILSTDYFGRLTELIDPSVIPVEYGGDCPEGGDEGVHWDLKFPDSTGCSRRQIERAVKQGILSHVEHYTLNEGVNMLKALNLNPDYKNDAAEILCHLKNAQEDLPEGEDKEKLTEILKVVKDLAIFPDIVKT